MAGIQICGKQGDHPYYIKQININVYSLEEISYFIYNYINQLYRDFFCDKLYDYIENELECKEIADHLRKMEEDGAETKDLIYFMLKVSRYYDPREINEIKPLVDNIDSMSKEERQRMEADKLVKQNKYNQAIRIFNEILEEREKKTMPDSFYAEIAYSIGAIYAKLFINKTASNYFEEAYKIVPDAKYAKACAYMSIINGDEEETLRAIIKFRITDEQLKTMRAAVSSAKKEIESSGATKAFEENLEKETDFTSIVDKWKQEYYNMQS